MRASTTSPPRRDVELWCEPDKVPNYEAFFNGSDPQNNDDWRSTEWQDEWMQSWCRARAFAKELSIKDGARFDRDFVWNLTDVHRKHNRPASAESRDSRLEFDRERLNMHDGKRLHVDVQPDDTYYQLLYAILVFTEDLDLLSGIEYILDFLLTSYERPSLSRSLKMSRHRTFRYIPASQVLDAHLEAIFFRRTTTDFAAKLLASEGRLSEAHSSAMLPWLLTEGKWWALNDPRLVALIPRDRLDNSLVLLYLLDRLDEECDADSNEGNFFSNTTLIECGDEIGQRPEMRTVKYFPLRSMLQYFSVEILGRPVCGPVRAFGRPELTPEAYLGKILATCTTELGRRFPGRGLHGAEAGGNSDGLNQTSGTGPSLSSSSAAAATARFPIGSHAGGAVPAPDPGSSAVAESPRNAMRGPADRSARSPSFVTARSPSSDSAARAADAGAHDHNLPAARPHSARASASGEPAGGGASTSEEQQPPSAYFEWCRRRDEVLATLDALRDRLGA